MTHAEPAHHAPHDAHRTPSGDAPGPIVLLGGGIAGLWLLDELRRAGVEALLFEASALGSGQTVWSQGIIHGGLKYTLQGLLTPSAQAIRDMPGVWRECLAGAREPDLSAVTVRSRHCYLWQTSSLSSRFGMIGARVGLRVKPVTVAPDQRPLPLAHVPGVVAQLDEQVVEPASLLAVLAQRNAGRVRRIDASSVRFEGDPDRPILTLRSPEGHETVLTPTMVVLTAGAGNGPLRRAAGLDAQVMQLRPLHMAMCRAADSAPDLPPLNGHCVDGKRTRLTITSGVDASGRTVWQLGGQLAEEGVQQDAGALIAHAQRELHAVLPGFAFPQLDWSAYRSDRAERRTGSGLRPDDAEVLIEGAIATVWPTKLALAPRVAERLLPVIDQRLNGRRPAQTELPASWPAAEPSAPAWELVDWTTAHHDHE